MTPRRGIESTGSSSSRPLLVLPVRLGSFARGPVARFARADLRALHDVHQTVVLFMAGELEESRLDARPEHFRRPRPDPRRRILHREFVFERLRVRDGETLDKMHAGGRPAPLAARIEVV